MAKGEKGAGEGAKKPLAWWARAAGNEKTLAGAILKVGFENGAVALGAVGVGAFAEEGIEFIHEEVGGFVGVVVGDGGDEVGAANHDLAFGENDQIWGGVRQ